MYSEDISVNGNTGTTPNTAEGSLTYSLVSLSNSGSRRAVSSLANTNPQTLSIQHAESTRNSIKRRRSLVRIDATVDDTELGLVPYSAYVVVDAPIGTDVTTANVSAAIGRLFVFLQTSGNVDKLLNGEP